MKRSTLVIHVNCCTGSNFRGEKLRLQVTYGSFYYSSNNIHIITAAGLRNKRKHNYYTNEYDNR